MTARFWLALAAIVLYFILSSIALTRCDSKDVADVVRALASWWRWPRS